MGSGSWSDDAYAHISSGYSGKSTTPIFTNTSLSSDMDPKDVAFRESRDSAEHPESLAIMVLVDVTGSMSWVPKKLITEKLGNLMSTLLDHGVEHPQILFGAIGDQYSDDSPLQISQFEIDTQLIDKWLKNIYLEGGGGGGGRESYLLSWYFAARHTSIDCYEKRGQKGFLFTIGDEKSWESIEPKEGQKIFGDQFGSEKMSAKQLFSEASRNYHVFHIHAQEGSYRDDRYTFNEWRDIMGQNFIVMDDSEAIGEIIASTVALVRGEDLKTITSSFDNKTAKLVSNALSGINALVKHDETGGMIKL
jgi:hypothetical protein